jgi:hypothetical protein
MEMNFSSDWFDTEVGMYKRGFQIETKDASKGTWWDRFLMKIRHRSQPNKID